MQFGKLFFEPFESRSDLAAEPTAETMQGLGLKDAFVTEIDDSLADTAAFCGHYHIGLDASANCVVVEARRGDTVTYAALMVLATTKADVNGIVRRHLGARKISFAPMEKATALTGMMYGGITPIGLPSEWPVIIDIRVAHTDLVIIGSGLRKSKILIPGSMLLSLPNAIVLDIVKI